MRIQTKRTVLRYWNDYDAAAIADVANNKRIFDKLTDRFPYPYTIEDARQFIRITKRKNDLSEFFAIEIEGKAVGSVGITFKEDIYKKNAEIGYFLGETWWGRGLMTEIITGLVSYIFSEYPIDRIYARPYAYNTGSRRVLEKNGFRCEAVLKKNVIKNGKLIDSCIYAILREEHSS